MKNLALTFALSLVAVGAFASSRTAGNSQAPVLTAKVSALPVPMCPPSDPNCCHMNGN